MNDIVTPIAVPGETVPGTLADVLHLDGTSEAEREYKARMAILDRGLPTEPARCAPSREALAVTIHRVWHRAECECVLSDLDAGEHEAVTATADAVQALYAGQRTEAEVMHQTLDSYRISPAVQDVAYERATHAERGWTAEHDARHGYGHLLKLSADYSRRYQADAVNRRPVNRGDLVKAASLLVAAIELIDSTAQPTPVFEAMGLPTAEVPNVGGEDRG